jgi:FAD/FMN-containing dehydrogenase
MGNKIDKDTNSNRFEYGNIFLTWGGVINSKRKMLPLSDLRHVLNVDTQAKTATIEGACTMKRIADVLVPMGFMLAIHPEMHEITVGGAIAGIGIESAGHRNGFFHDNVFEVEVLGADGTVRIANASNEHSDLFAALPNSYGTLGYILMAKLRIVPASPYVHMKNSIYTSLKDLLKDMKSIADEKQTHFLEALVFNKNHSILSQTTLLYETPPVVDDIYQNNYHLLLQQKTDMYLPIQDYMFRFEPDLFCNWFDKGENPLQDFFRRVLPHHKRNSGFYRAAGFQIEAHVEAIKAMIKGKAEPLIQDWEVPWDHGYDFLQETFSGVTLPLGKPWLIFAIRPNSFPTNYPLDDSLYLNLGVYLKDAGVDSGKSGGFGKTKFIDSLAFKHNGTKMLYSTSFATEEEYRERYNGKAYDQVKAKYDPGNTFKTLYEKCFNNVYS